MNPLVTFNVIPKLPSSIEPLRELAYNMWWSWEPTARRLFRDLDVPLWEETNHNPVRMLQLCRQSRLIEISQDEHYLKELKQVITAFHNYLSRKDTYASTRSNPSIAYFSAEYGLHESFPNYSGGLGILSGDHCKSASDLGLDFTAVGLLYRDGYFKQQINSHGWQEAKELNQVFHYLPITEVKINNEPLKISIPLPGRLVIARVWHIALGRIKIYLLDTTIPENKPTDQHISATLYGGNNELRIQQEIVLGMGGVKLLKALGIHPKVYHMNEGHSAFLSLERIRDLVRNKENEIDFSSAFQVVAASNIFTTHTPVPAGNDAFSEELMRAYFGHYPEEVGISWHQFMHLGEMETNPKALFSMTVLALKTSRFANGVSKLHGTVSRGLWQDLWKDIPVSEVPIISITNGVHAKTWAAGEFHDLYEKYLGKNWEDRQSDMEFWRGVIDIPDAVLWDLHQVLKHRTIEFMRERVRAQRIRNGEPPDTIREVNHLLNGDVLMIGFARRFATYKRGALLFTDPERLRRLVTNKEHPVQFIFAGKAHPADEEGKKIIQEVYNHSRDPLFENRIIFVEDYDINVGRRLYQGCDLWLNNPLRPYEASGTSGMKLPLNGGINLSVLDGWWLESYNGKNGWAIGSDMVGGTEEEQDEGDIASLFSLLENQIVPLYYAKPDGRLPLAWIQAMRESMRTVVPLFNTHRMVQEYNTTLYEPAAHGYALMEQDHFKAAHELSHWKNKMTSLWSHIKIIDYGIAHQESHHDFFVGENVVIHALVHLGSIRPADVQVQTYFGSLEKNKVVIPHLQEMMVEEIVSEGVFRYAATIPAAESGTYGLNVRVIPSHPYLLQAHELKLISWACSNPHISY
jgi:starch phosphorylase